jgi:hypothetical protein
MYLLSPSSSCLGMILFQQLHLDDIWIPKNTCLLYLSLHIFEVGPHGIIPANCAPFLQHAPKLEGWPNTHYFVPPASTYSPMLILCNYKFNLPAFFIIELKIKPNDSSLLACIAFVAPTWINLTITTTLLIDDLLYLCDSDLRYYSAKMVSLILES